MTSYYIQIEDTKGFLNLFVSDPKTKYPVVVTTKQSSRPGKPGYTCWLAIARDKTDLLELINGRNIIGQLPASVFRGPDQTNIDLATGGRIEVDSAFLVDNGIVKDDAHIPFVTQVRKDDLTHVYDALLDLYQRR